MDTNESRAVSPVVGVILVVVITVALSGVVGVFVFNLGQSVSDSTTQSDIATRTTYNDDGTATIQVVTGESDKLRVSVNGSAVETTKVNLSPGDTLTVDATPESRLEIISITEGDATVVATTSGPSTPLPPSEGLLVHYPLSGTADDAVGSNDGIVYGATFEDRSRGTVAVFNGTSDYIDLPDNNWISGTQKFTLSAWAYTNDDTKSQGILNLEYNIDNRAYVYYSGGSTCCAGIWMERQTEAGGALIKSEGLQGEWHLFTATWNGTNVTFYLDGERQATTEFTSSMTSNTFSHAYIGKRGNGYGKYFDGEISDVRIYNRSLSDPEVSDLYNGTK